MTYSLLIFIHNDIKGDIWDSLKYINNYKIEIDKFLNFIDHYHEKVFIINAIMEIINSKIYTNLSINKRQFLLNNFHIKIKD